jgi:hypothetical protein
MVTFPNDYEHIADLREPAGFFRLVRCYLNPPESPTAADAQFLWIIQRAPRARLDPAGEHGLLTRFAGQGGLAVLGMGKFHSAVVVDDTGIRTFGWVERGFDRSGWAEPGSQGTYAAPDDPALADSLDGWPDPSAEWIGDGTSVNYLCRFLDTDARPSKQVRSDIWVSGAGRWELWMDADLVAEGEAFQQTRVDFVVPAGGVQVALKVEDGPGIWTMLGKDADDETVGVLYRSFAAPTTGDPDPWLALEDTEPDGVTYGYVMSRLVDEAQARGAIPGVSYTFDDDVDSDGDPWTVSLPVVAYRDGVQLGDVVLQATQQFRAACRMSPTLELELFNVLGDDLSATVQFAEGLSDPGANDLVSADVDVQAPLATVVRVGTDGRYGWVVDSPQVVEFGRRESSATYGMAKTPQEVTDAAEGLLDDLRGKVRQVLNVATSAVYTDFGPGDWVGVREVPAGPFETYRVEQVAPSEVDEAGNVEVDVDVERRL